MLPILYKANETNFTHNGIGILRDAITAVATEELNGMFELQMEYDSKGEFAHVIDEEMIIKAKANDKQDPQLFRIYSIEKNHDNDNLIIDAQHITYDLANNFVEKLEARNITKKQVMELIGASTVYPHPFNVTSSNNTTRSTTNLYRTNPLQMIGGMDGSVLQIWGGQLERDNYHLIMHDRRGRDDGVEIQYAKNLTGLTAKVDISNVVTRIYPFAYNDEDDRLITITGKYVDSDHINDYDIIRVMPVDYSQDEEIDWEQTDAQIRSKLTQLASRYFIETGNDKPKTEIDVEFEHLWETKEYKDLDVLELVGMGDTVHIHHSKLNVTATAIVNRIEYDVLADVNIRVGIGNVKSRLSDNMNRIDRVEEKVDRAESNANQAIISANGKNKNYYGPDMPTNNLNEGDTWFQLIDGQYTRTWRYDGIQWQLIIDMDVNDAYEQAQEAKDDAQQAVDRANQATANANQAISNAQTAFDAAQSAINQSTSAFNLANQAFEDVAALSTMVDTNTGEISTIKQSVEGLQVSVSDAQGNASNALQIASGLQTTVSNVEGQVSTLQQTATNISSRIDNLQIGGRNILGNSKKPELRTNNSTTSPLNRTEYEDYWRYEPQNNSGLSTYSHLNTSDYPIYDKSWLGRDMAVSITVRVSKDVKLRFRFSDWGVAGTRIKEDYFDVKASDGWTILKMPVPKNLITRNPDTEPIRFLLYTADNGNTTITPYDGYIDVKDWFIGFGTKVSDWSPAPEDTDQKFSAINQTIDNIATRVQNAEGDITSVTQIAQGLQTRVSNAEGNINTVTTLANTNQAKIQDAEGNINTLTQTATSLQSTISNIRVGGENLLRYTTKSFYTYDSNNMGGNWGDFLISSQHRNIPVTPGEQYTASIYLEANNNNTIRVCIMARLTQTDSATPRTEFRGEYFAAGEEGYSEVTFTVPADRYFLTIYAVRYDVATSARNIVRYKELQLTKGNVKMSWAPYLEDMATQSQITQLSDNINLRVEKGDVINQINVSTESILISGRKVHITGQTTIDNASIDGAKIKDASIGTAQIGSIDASKINVGILSGLEINGNNINGGRIVGASFFNEGADGDVRIANGRISATNIWTHSNGVYASEVGYVILRSYDDWLYLQTPSEVRVTKPRTYDQFSDLRASQILAERRFYSKGNYIGENNTVFGSDNGWVMLRTASWNDPVYLQGSHIVATRPREPSSYVRIAGNTLKSMNGNFEGTGNTNFTTSSGYVVLRSGADTQPVYLQGVEIRATLTSSAGTYVPMRASAFPTGSLAEYKQDIEVWEGNALDIINRSTVYEYRLKTEFENGINRKRQGLVIGDGYSISREFIDGDGVEQYLINSISLKAIQELDSKSNAHEGRINTLELENQYLKQKIKQLEEAL